MKTLNILSFFLSAVACAPQHGQNVKVVTHTISVYAKSKHPHKTSVPGFHLNSNQTDATSTFMPVSTTALLTSTSGPSPTTAPPIQTSTPATPNPLASQFLTLHNNYRKIHNAPDLVWSDTMAATAQSYADSCVWGHTSAGSSVPIGQNIYAGTIDGQNVQDALQMWYDEYKSYDYVNAISTDGSEILHFTQIVWKGSQNLGCGVANCPQISGLNFGGVYVVCDYNLPGNVIGEFQQNVFPPINA